MITNANVVALQGLTKKNPQAVKLTTPGYGALYSSWFVLELPLKLFAPAFTGWAAVPHPAIKDWRKALPPGNGAYAQAVRWKNPKDEMVLVKLISDEGVALVHPSLYDVVVQNLLEPEFRVFPCDHAHVAILNAGVVVGGAGQVVL